TKLGIRGGADGLVRRPDPILRLGAIAIPELQLLAVDIVAMVHVEALIVFGRDRRMKAGSRDIPGALPPPRGIPFLGALSITMLKARRIAIVEISVGAA